MILDHCHKASCVQIIESLRAKVAELEAKLAKYQNLEPFGFWHQGNDIDESDFFLFKDSGDVACEKCVKLYTHPLPPADVVRDAERYKWLRKVAPNMFWDNHDKEIGFVRFDTKAYLWKPEMFDAAIDKAMKEMK